jgi:internalin A
MKYIYSLLLIVIIICPCCTRQQNTESLSAHSVDDTIANILENGMGDNNNTNQYSFRFSNGTYWNMNDLTYFLADTSIKSLHLYRGTFSDLSPLAELTELEELEISGNNYITDISPIGSLVNLKKLTLFNEAYKVSIEALSSLVNLKYLQLAYNDRYYRELLPLRQLEELRLLNALSVVLDATYIAQLSSLKGLAYTGGGDPEGIINIEQFKNLVNLEWLYICSNNNLDLSWITYLHKLNKLDFIGCTINDISPLLELPNLVRVEFRDARIEDITPLLESTSIKRVNIDRPINEMDSDELYRLFGERDIEFTIYLGDR